MDSYGYIWETGNIINDTTMTQKCSLGVPAAIGSASWICNYDGGKCNNGKFTTSQPNYSNCTNSELQEIIDSVKSKTITFKCIIYKLSILKCNNALQASHAESNVTEIWMNVTDFTSRENVSYYGHEIFTILDLMIDLLDKQRREMNNGTVGRVQLSSEIITSYYATNTTNNLISNDDQWAQLNDVSIL